MLRACCFCPFQILRGLSDKTAELREAATLQSFPAFFVWHKKKPIWFEASFCKILIVSLEVWYLLILYHIKFHIELPIAPGRGCKVLWWSSNELGPGVVACWAAKQNGGWRLRVLSHQSIIRIFNYWSIYHMHPYAMIYLSNADERSWRRRGNERLVLASVKISRIRAV